MCQSLPRALEGVRNIEAGLFLISVLSASLVTIQGLLLWSKRTPPGPTSQAQGMYIESSSHLTLDKRRTVMNFDASVMELAPEVT